MVEQPQRELLKDQVRRNLDLTAELEDGDVYAAINDVILEFARNRFLSLSEKMELREEIFNSIRRLDVLQELLEDDSITEIMVNRYDQIFVEKEGRLFKWDRGFSTKEKYEDVIQQIVAASNRIVNQASPIVDARLKDGSRVNVILEPIALDGSALTIRKFPKEAMSMEKLVQKESLTNEVADMLKLFVQSGYNLFISGGTGSGKTTFLNALSGSIPEDSRVITIEDSAELRLIGIPNLIRLEVRNANVEGSNQITIRDLVKNSLRSRPDYLVVGEIRGGEAIDMLQALNTGHSGLSTGHANSSRDMLSRMETMALMGMDMPLAAIRSQIASAIDIIIHLGRLRDRTRRVLEIMEIEGYEDGEIAGRTLCRFVETGEEDGKIKGELQFINGILHRDKLFLNGNEENYEELEKKIMQGKTEL